jgi:hypothetical protein
VNNLVIYGSAAMAVIAVWVVGLMRLDVFTPDDVRALRRLADLRRYARPRSRFDKAINQMPLLRRAQAELDLERLLAVSGRSDTPIGFLGRSLSLSLAAFAATLALDALGRASLSDWPVNFWIAPLFGVFVFLGRLAHLRAQTRVAQHSINRTLEDALMPVAILTDSRGLQLHDALRLVSRCATDDALARLLGDQGWKRLVPLAYGSTQELYRLIGSAYGVALLTKLSEAQETAHVGVPEREIYARLAESVYRERLVNARSQAARAKVLVTLPIAAMLIPLLLLLGAPTLHAITMGLQGG